MDLNNKINESIKMMKKMRTNTRRKNNFIVLATLALTVGVGVALEPKDVLKVKAAVETYEEVTSNQADWSGEYLIVSKVDNLAMDGNLSTLDAVENSVAVTITSGKISLDSKHSFSIIKNGANYDIKSTSNKYIYGKSGDTNGLDTDTMANTIKSNISYDSSSVAIIQSTGTNSNYLVYNSTSNQRRFRYFRSSTSNAGKGSGVYHAVSLFKKTTGETPITDTFELDKTSLELDLIESYQIVPSFLPAEANPAITYSIASQSNPDGVVSVTSGLITGLREGTATVMASTNDGSNLSASVTVTVSGNYASHVLTPADAHELEVDDNVTIRGKVVTEVQNNGSYAIQVGNRGIMTYLIGTLTVGNDVVITGKMGAYSGLPQIVSPTSVIDLGPSTTTVTPQIITSHPQLTAELSGTLVQIDGMEYKSGTFSTTVASSVTLALGGTNVAMRATASVDNSAINTANGIFNTTGTDDTLNITTTAGWFNGVQLLFTADSIIEKIAPVFGTLDRIVLTTTNVKNSYYVGEAFSLAGLVVTAYDDVNLARIVTIEATSSLASGYTFVTGDIGSKTITITYVLDEITKTATFNITIEAAPAWTKVTMAYDGATGNMVDGNNAAIVGLDSTIFTVTSTKGSQNNHVGLNKDGNIRLYYHSSGNGATLGVSITEGKLISKIVFNFGSTVTKARILLGGIEKYNDTPTQNTAVTFEDFEATSFSIQNVNTTSAQLYIDSIDIYYLDPVYEEAKAFADWMMDETRDSEVCEDKFLEGWLMWDELSTEAKVLFESHADFGDAQQRLLNWAIANELTSLDDLDNLESLKTVGSIKDNNFNASIILGIIGLTTIVSYYFIRRKKEA